MVDLKKREQGLLEEDRFGWINLSAMSILLSLETEAGEVGVAWRHLLSAVSLQEPRLQQRMRMDIFRQQPLTCLLALYFRNLARETATVDLTEEEEGEQTLSRRPRPPRDGQRHGGTEGRIEVLYSKKYFYSKK